MRGPKPATIVGAALLVTALNACTGNSQQPGDVPVFDGIGEGERISAVGNEPFWNATVEGNVLNYATPENIDGSQIEVTRFAGNGGLGISGTLSGEPLQLAITPGDCSDTMSDRSYPYTATLTIGGEQRNGCAYTDQQPFTGEPNP